MKFRQIFVLVFFAIACVCLLPGLGLATQGNIQIDGTAPVGTQGHLAGAAWDEDADDLYDTVQITVTGDWDSVVYDSVTYPPGIEWFATKTRDTPGENPAIIHYSDGAIYGEWSDDADGTMNQSLWFIGATAIQGPSVMTKNCCAKFTSASDPASRPDLTQQNQVIWHDGWVHFYYRKQGEPLDGDHIYPMSSQVVNHVSECRATFSEAGTYMIYARAEMSYPYTLVSPWSLAKTKVVTVLDSPPDCPKKADPGDPDGGTTCTTKSCGGGSGATNSNPTVMVYRCLPCDSDTPVYQWQVTTCSCHVVNFPQPPITADVSASLGDGYTVTMHTNLSYTVVDGVGDTWQYAAANFAQGDFAAGAHLLSYTDSNGNITTYGYSTTDGGLTDKTTQAPNNAVTGTWTYTHEPDSDRITSVTGPDGNTTTTTYFPAGSGWAEHKIQSIVVTDPSGNEIDRTEYNYDQYGWVDTETVNDKITTYSYTLDANYNYTSKTATLVSATPQIVTVYGYSTDTDTVTVKHPTDSTKDEVTATRYFTKTASSITKRTGYVYTATNAAGGVTKYSTYVPEGTDTAGMQTDTDYRVALDYIISDNVNLLGKAFRVTDANGGVTIYQFDPNTGNVLSVTHPDDSTDTYSYVSTSYPGAGFLLTSKNGRGIYTHYVRDTANLGHVLAVKVSGPVNGLEPDWSTVPNNSETDFYPINDSHGQGGRVWKQRVPSIDGAVANEKIYEYYETIDSVEKLRNGATRVSHQYWDSSAGAYTEQIDQMSYNAAGRVIRTTDALGRMIENTYDAKGRQVKSEFGTVFTENSYSCCTMDWSKDADGRTTHYVYDDAKRVRDIWTDAPGQSLDTPLVHYDYDSFGNVSTVTTRSAADVARVTSYTYDKMNRVVRIDYPAPLGYEAFGYDALGNTWWKRNGKGEVTLYRYDEMRRLTNTYYNYTGALPPTQYPTAASVSYSYTDDSQSVTDSTGTSSFTYDAQGRVIGYQPPVPNGGAPVTYTYNNLGEKTSVSSTDYLVTYEYYANGWLKNVKRSGNVISSYSYDQVGNREAVTYGNGTYMEHSYDTDPRYRLSGIDYAYKCDSLSQIAEHGGLRLSRDNAGNPLSWSDSTERYIKRFGYDSNSRLISAKLSGVADTAYEYDWVGNRLNPGGMVYNAADQLVSGAGYTYQYDGAGNMTVQTGPANKTYTYTPANLPETIVHNGSLTSSMTWDTLGNRVSFISSTLGSWQYVYDITAKIPAVLREIAPDGSSWLYIREPKGTLLARVKQGNGTEGHIGVDLASIQYYHFDNLGSTQFLTDNTGVLTDKYTYGVWGNVTSHTGSTEDNPYQFVGRFGYYAYYQDSNLPYIQTGSGLYDVGTGRHLQREKVNSHKTSEYAYARNSPTALRDVSATSNGNAGDLNSAYLVYCDINCFRKYKCNIFKRLKCMETCRFYSYSCWAYMNDDPYANAEDEKKRINCCWQYYLRIEDDADSDNQKCMENYCDQWFPYF